AADVQGKSFTQLFGAFGAFSVLAGILLLVNIFVMLAQERKTELGMLRAIGLRRNRLVGSFSLEGWFYAIASSVVGALVGVAIGALMTLSGIAGKSGGPALLGPAILGLGIVPLLRRYVDGRTLVSVVSGIVLFWAVICFSVLKGAFQKSGVTIFVVQGAVL